MIPVGIVDAGSRETQLVLAMFGGLRIGDGPCRVFSMVALALSSPARSTDLNLIARCVATYFDEILKGDQASRSACCSC
jgi:hypothetical protein